MRHGTFIHAIRLAANVAAAIVLTAAPALAGVLNIYGSAAPTIGLPGYTTYTLSVETDVARVQGFDFLGGGSMGQRGFFGAMHQVNPGGASSVFNDANASMPFFGYNSTQDSQLLFSSGDGLSIAPSESANSLRGVLATFQPMGQNFAFAQIVVPDGEQVSFRGGVAYEVDFLHLYPTQSIEGVVGEGLLFSKEVVPLPQPVVVPAPEPAPTPLPVPVPTPTPAPEPETPPILPPELIIEIGPTGPLPPEPEPIDPVVSDDPGFITFPIFRPIDWHIGSVQWPEGIVGGPYLIDYTELPPGAVIAIDTSTEIFLDGRMQLFATDGDTPYPLVHNATTTGTMAYDGALAAFLNGNGVSQVPEPAAWCLAALLLGSVFAFRRRAL